jgi:plasmid stabilization system protein ParE
MLPEKWSVAAIMDVEDILDYILLHWGEDFALRFKRNLERTVLSVRKNPEIYSLFNRRRQIRKCRVDKLNALYDQIKPDYIEILRIYSDRRNPSKLKF